MRAMVQFYQEFKDWGSDTTFEVVTTSHDFVQLSMRLSTDMPVNIELSAKQVILLKNQLENWLGEIAT